MKRPLLVILVKVILLIRRLSHPRARKCVYVFYPNEHPPNHQLCSYLVSRENWKYEKDLSTILCLMSLVLEIIKKLYFIYVFIND